MEQDRLAIRVRCAAVAAWWTVLVAAVWMTIAWCFWTFILTVPALGDFVEALWAHAVTISDMKLLIILFFGLFKLILFVGVLIAIFLTIWGRKLGRAGAGE